MSNTKKTAQAIVRKLNVWVLALAAALPLAAQTKKAPETPKLIVGIVVDQMRYDYLYRYSSKYGSGGFKRLLREGFSCENTHYNYIPTYTAPGHAAVYTGATPATNGIISNEWWDPEWGKHRYVTTDPRYKTVGAPGKVGQHSPSVLLSSTVSDELRLFYNFRSKVVGICLKDRGSILPAGHIPNGAYWFDDATGNWITSTYYPDSTGLPKWVEGFNNQRLADKYMADPWNKRLPNTAYDESYFGWSQYKGAFGGTQFPYDLAALKSAQKNYGALRYTPFGNTLTLDFALSAVENMELGQDSFPDMLCLSFSSTDYCGHLFGVHAEETQDVYLRLDKDIERLLTYLDQKVGKNNVLVFLTADHGGAETPVHMNALRIPAGVMPESTLEQGINKAIGETFGKPGNVYVHEAMSYQVWLDRKALRDSGIGLSEAQAVVVRYLRTVPGVYDAFSKEDLFRLPSDYPFAVALRQGVHPRRSGDVFFMLDPAWHADDKYFVKTGTTHGSPYPYDTHVPLLWYGWQVPTGRNHKPTHVIDIAPTLSAMLRIMEPNGNTGQIIESLMR